MEVIQNAIAARFCTVIVNYNSGPLLLDCVRTALGEGIAPERIIIVDNGSKDGSVERLMAAMNGPQVVRNNCNTGFARAVNQGLALAEGDFVLLLNTDALLEQGTLQAFADAFDGTPGLAIAGGQLYYPDGRLQAAIAPRPTLAEELLPLMLLKTISPDRYRRKATGQSAMAVESVIGACLAVRRSSLETLGLLDEDFFFFFEETEWCERAWDKGMKVYHLPTARAMHLQGHTANQFWKEARVEYQRSKLTYFRKKRPLAQYLALSAFLPLRTLINAVTNGLWCAITLGGSARQRVKAKGYAYLFAWHALGRPHGWGLPERCPGRGR